MDRSIYTLTFLKRVIPVVFARVRVCRGRIRSHGFSNLVCLVFSSRRPMFSGPTARNIISLPFCCYGCSVWFPLVVRSIFPSSPPRSHTRFTSLFNQRFSSILSLAALPRCARLNPLSPAPLLFSVLKVKTPQPQSVCFTSSSPFLYVLSGF